MVPLRFLVLLGGGLFAGTALAQQPSAPAAPGKPADVTILASTCVGCHGVAYEGAHGVPALRGNKESEIAAALHAFKTDARPATMMNRLAKGYSEPEIQALALYFSKLK